MPGGSGWTADGATSVARQGTSFLPLASGASTEPINPTGIYYYRYFENDDPWHHVFAHYGLRTERFKLIYFYADEADLPGASALTFVPEWELYDLDADPHELNNVYVDPAYAGVVRELTEQLHRVHADLGDEPHKTDPVFEAGPRRLTRRQSGSPMVSWTITVSPSSMPSARRTATLSGTR